MGPDQEDGLLPRRQGGRSQQTWGNQERWERHGNNRGCCQGWPGGLRHSLQWIEGERQSARQQLEAEQREGGAAQVRQPGWRRVRESLHRRWQRCHDLHEHPELGRQGPGEEDRQEHREEYCQEHRGDRVGGEEGGDTSRSETVKVFHESENTVRSLCFKKHSASRNTFYAMI